MIVPRYVPGGWIAVVSDGVVAMVPGDTGDRTVDRLWSSLREGGGPSALAEHLEVLMEGGLASVPPFALVALSDGRVHAIVRGAVEVLVDADDGEHQLDGSAVTTWHEASVGRARAVHVRAADGMPADGGSLPVLSAVVRAASVDIDLARETDVQAEGGRGQDGRRDGGRRAAGREPAHVPSPRAATPPPAPAPTTPAVPAHLDESPSREQPPADEELAAWAPGSPSMDVPALVPDDAPGGSATDHASDAPATDDSPAEPVPATTGGAATASGDHDGLTVQSSDVATLRRQLPEWAGDAVPGPFSVPAPQAPPPAKIHLSSGLVISLNRPVLLGRAPQVSRVQNSQIPRLVTVASPNQDISRTHAEVRQDGEHVIVTDLRSTNGVLLLREGTGPQRLHPGEPTVVEPGVVVDLGEGVTFVVEHGP